MNCRFPDVTNLRCWLCPHNPHLHDLPIMSVHAILKREEAERVRRPCWEDDEEFHNFDLLVPLPGELDDELTEMLADIGFSAEKIAMNRVTGEILYALSPITAEEKSSAADEAEPDDEDDDWPDDSEDEEEEDEDDWPDYDDEDEESDDEDWPEDDPDDDWDEDYEEDDDDPTDYLPHLNQTLEGALMPEVQHVGDALDDLLELIFDLYKVFPFKKDVLSDMEDTVCEMMDLHDDLLDLVEAYNYEIEED